MKTFLNFLFVILLAGEMDCQYNYKFAPEKWSEPVLVAGLENQYATAPFISADGKKLFFNIGKYVEKTDTGWSEVRDLNSNIDKNLVRSICITPDSKTLFFTWWYYGGWDLFYSEWDTSKQDWGEAKWGGYELNNEDYEEGCTFPNDTTLIFLRSERTHISLFNRRENKWSEAKEWPSWGKGFSSYSGIHMTPDWKKMYVTRDTFHKSPTGREYVDCDICVHYKDSIAALEYSNRGYSPPMLLNITLYSDSMFNAKKFAETFDGEASLSLDGKTIYFCANYIAVNEYRIYESHMIIDENGNPVTAVEDKKNARMPDDAILFPPYPNPFNPQTNIRYSLPREMKVKITLYDIAGRKIRDLREAIESGGTHTISISTDNLSSGIYLIHLQTPYHSLIQKAVVIK